VTQARLVKKATDDGLYEFTDDIPLGRLYDVDLVHARRVALFNLEKRVEHEKVLVKDLERPGWLPLECLAVES
jgi:hypothetical protein